MKAREADLRAERVVSEAQELFGRSMLSSGVSRMRPTNEVAAAGNAPSARCNRSLQDFLLLENVWRFRSGATGNPHDSRAAAGDAPSARCNRSLQDFLLLENV
jgi:hypothetical protein